MATKTSAMQKHSGKMISYRWIVISIVIIIIIVAAYILISNNAAVTKEEAIFRTITSPCIPSQCTVIGNNFTHLSIPVEALSNANTPFANITINAKTNVGFITGVCVTGDSGFCYLNYTAPKISSELKASVTLNAKNVTKTFTIIIKPDAASSLTVTASRRNLLANGASSTTIYAKAVDNQSSLVPNGTKIRFSLSPENDGALSNSYCTTTNGTCNITYTSSMIPGNVTVNAFSGTAITNVSLSLSKPQEYKKTILSQQYLPLQCNQYNYNEFTVPAGAYNITVSGAFTSTGQVYFSILTPTELASWPGFYLPDSPSVYTVGPTVGEPVNFTLSSGTYYVTITNADMSGIFGGCGGNSTVTVQITSPIVLNYYD
ncbi:MAG: hypothetical protein QXL94_05265 [Candidatus Parvarchaeum sp.]